VTKAEKIKMYCDNSADMMKAAKEKAEKICIESGINEYRFDDNSTLIISGPFVAAFKSEV
jgi:hypothetical protein